MRPELIVFAGLAGLATTALHAAPTVVEAVRTDRAPTIDGRLDDECWAAARPVTSFLINNTDRPAQYPTAALVMFDDTHLYIGARCSEPAVANIQTRELPRDHDDVFRTDCIEVMLDPGRTRNDFFHFGVNASGAVADEARTQGGFIGDGSWDAPVQAAAFIGEDYWSCEIAIPFYALGLTPAVTDTWHINICREKKQPGENSSIAEQGAFNIASRFVELHGVTADLHRFCYALGTPQPEQKIREGQVDLTLRVPVTNATGEAGARLLDAWLIGPQEQVVAAQATTAVPPGQSETVALGPMAIADQGEYTCYVRVADPVTKQALALSKSALRVQYVPLAIRLVTPWYRDAIFATQNVEQVELDVNVSLEPAALTGTTLEVTVAEAATGTVLATQRLDAVATTNRITFAATPLPEARMTLKARLTAVGGELLAETTHPLRKLPRVEGEVWLGRDLNWRVDGELFFLNGAWNYAEDYLPEYNAFTNGGPANVKLLDCRPMNDLYYKCPSMRGDALSEEDAALLREYARQAGRSAQLFAYYVSDEPEVTGTKARVLEQVYAVFADADPYHPVVLSNDSMEGLRAYADCADINGLHPYPVILRDREMNDLSPVAIFTSGAVSFFTDRSHKQTIAYLHQGFNYGDYGAVNNRIPTYQEYRNQNLLALICGAKGIIQYNRMVAHYPELYLGMPHLAREHAYLGPILMAPEAEAQATADSEALRVLVKEYAGQIYILACNADLAGREVTLTVPGLAGRAQRLAVVSEEREVAIAGDAFTDHFGPFEAHVYTTGPAPALTAVDSIVAEIAVANAARRKPGNLAFQEFEGDGVVVTASSNYASRYQRPDTGLWHVVDGVVDTVDHYHCLT